MTHSRPAVLLLALALLWFCCGNDADAQQLAIPSGSKQQVLYLNRANSGQHS